MSKPSSFSWRPATTLVIISGSILAVVAIAVYFISTNVRPTSSLQVGSGMYRVWLADTEQARVQGLSGVGRLKANGGLLMDFKEDGNNGIWMKDMLIPLDIIWLDSNKKVIHVEQNVSPDLGTSKTFMPEAWSRYVLELSAGSAEKSAIKVGQTASFSIGDSR